MPGRGMALAGMVTVALFALLPHAAQADLTQVRAATENLSGAAFGVRDDQGVALDGLEVLQTGPGRYVGGYPTVSALVAGRAERTYVAPRRLSRTNEGTPSITVTRDGPGVAGLRVTTGLHYFADLDGDGLPDADRQATGVMRGFRTWTATARPDIDAQFFAATPFHAPYNAPVAGSIGDRDEVTLPDGTTAIVADAQYVRADFGAWRLFLRDPTGGPATPLNPVTPGGSLLTLPDERPALVFTGSVYGGAPGEGGTVVHVQPLG